jgi:ribosome-associated protein
MTRFCSIIIIGWNFAVYLQTKMIIYKYSRKVATKKSKAAPKEAPVILNETELQLKTIVDAMLDKKGKNVCTMDLTGIGTSICDHFVICNADSTPNVLAIADNVEDEMIVKCKTKVVRQQGRENAFWIIMDYGNIVVHIFQTEYREFYRLEDLWADADVKHFVDED